MFKVSGSNFDVDSYATMTYYVTLETVHVAHRIASFLILFNLYGGGGGVAI